MARTQYSHSATALLLLAISATISTFGIVSASPAPSPHGGDEDMGMSMNMSYVEVEWSESFDVPNYFSHPDYKFWIWGHIATMMLGWVVVLPVAVMFSIAKSRYSTLANIGFLAVNALGFVFGLIYNMSTPDLYENNAHHKIGWIFSAIALVWVLLGFIRVFTSKGSRKPSMHYQPLMQSEEGNPRWSDDSGRATLRNLSVGSTSPSALEQHSNSAFLPESLPKLEEEEEEQTEAARNGRINRFIGAHVAKHITGKMMWLINFIYVFIERTLVFMMFIAVSTGFVTFGGIFRHREVFSGLAHFIKGGIFFWIGVLAVGRWAGAFADLGWAWNVKPPASAIGLRKAKMPSSELVESCLIFLYGASNIWLEHLNATVWSAMDFEHLSITILFFGGGLLGMLIESKNVRKWLNISVTLSQPTTFTPTTNSGPSNSQQASSNLNATPENATWQQPLGSTTPMNPIPALTILLLGLIMSAHTQHSVLAATMHTYWGSLFALAAALRIGTYILHYFHPPTSYVPSRPPTEIVAGFCLIAGGFLFMLSPRDITDVVEGSGGDAMVAFTVDMGVTAVVSAGVVACMAIKGWAVTRENRGRIEQIEMSDRAAADQA